jgi:hypothetical protein
MKNHTQNNFLAYIIVLGAFFILIFFTKDIYGDIQETSDTLEVQNIELITNKTELTRLKKLQLELLEENSDALEDIKGFS